MSNSRAHARYLKKQRERTAAAADSRRKEWNEWVEKMYCAYLKDTKIPSSQAMLCHEKVEQDDKTVVDRYWFEHHEDRAKVIDAHPDIQYMFEIVSEMLRARKIDKTDTASINDGLDAIKELMDKYKTSVEEEVPDLRKLEEKAAKEEKADE